MAKLFGVKKKAIDFIDPTSMASANLRQDLEKLRKDAEDKRLLRGKHSPAQGVCRVCSGKVVAEIRFPATNLIGGAAPQAFVAHWYCENEDCGLMYRTPPKPKV